MTRALDLAAAAGLGAATLTLALRDPDQPYAIAGLVLALALAAGAGTARVLLGLARGGRSARARWERTRALRRGAEAGVIVGALLALRAIDGLTPLTAGFVMLAFVLAEVALTTRSPSVR